MTRRSLWREKIQPLIQNDSPSRWAQTVQSFSLWLPDCAMPLPWQISISAVAVLLLTAQRSGVLGTAQLRTQCLVWSANSPHPSQFTLQTSQACIIQGFCTKPLVKLLLLFLQLEDAWEEDKLDNGTDNSKVMDSILYGPFTQQLGLVILVGSLQIRTLWAL